MTPQSQSLPGAPPRRRSTVVLLVRREAPLAVPRTTLGESVRGDRRQLERWENEGGALGSAGAGPWSGPGGEAG